MQADLAGRDWVVLLYDIMDSYMVLYENWCDFRLLDGRDH
jgi:hypothetical protein